MLWAIKTHYRYVGDLFGGPLEIAAPQGYGNASSGDGGLKKCTLASSEGSALPQRIFTTGD
jgi:hypothetical protein